MILVKVNENKRY